jgi:hypothetical protein
MQLKATVLAGISTVIVAGALSIVGIVSPGFAAGPGPSCPTTGTPDAGSGGTAGGNCEITATTRVNAALAIATDFTSFSRSAIADLHHSRPIWRHRHG